MLEFKSPQMAVQETERGGKSSLSGIFCVDVCVCRHVNTHLSTIGGLSLDLSCFYTELMTFSNLLPSFIKYHKCNPLDLAFVFLNEHFTIKWKYNLLTWNRFKLKWLPAVDRKQAFQRMRWSLFSMPLQWIVTWAFKLQKWCECTNNVW